WSPASLSHAPPFDDPVQPVVAGANASAGQVPVVPVHVSATSHWPAAARHVVVVGWKASTHVFPDPEQWSPESLSQGPPFDDPVQLVVADANASAGQAADVPVHVSAASHGPAAALQVVDAGWNASAGHCALLPVHCSATSHAPAEPRHVVVESAKASDGHEGLLPVQVSATSQAPAEARQTVEPGTN
ncbi:MAG: hypothetical protein DMF86_24070, partial [Acidobacteria bacterium]